MVHANPRHIAPTCVILRFVWFGATPRLRVAVAMVLTAAMRFLMMALFAWSTEGVREQGARLESERKWKDASLLYEAALSTAEDSEGRFWLLTSLVEMAINRGDYRQARQWLRKAEDSQQGRPHVQLLNARATLHLVEGNLSAAKRDLSRAASISEKADAGTLHNLASVEMQTGRLKLAAEHQHKALTIWRQQFGDRHEYVMRAWISLSSIQGLQRDWQGAEESLRHALAIAETDEALSNYAVVLDHLKRGREAKQIRARIPAVAVPNALIDVKSVAAPVVAR